MIANADVVIKTGDIQQALNLLGKILPDQEYYLQAKTKAASIYLHHLNDRQAFAQCFRELVENCPGPDSFIMLGDAYMSIQGNKNNTCLYCVFIIFIFLLRTRPCHRGVRSSNNSKPKGFRIS